MFETRNHSLVDLLYSFDLGLPLPFTNIVFWEKYLRLNITDTRPLRPCNELISISAIL